MTVYLVYFFIILIVPPVLSAVLNNKQKAQNASLKILLFLLYLILALKAETVGSDIRGYGELYNYTGTLPFNDFSYTYMEKGYVLLMKLGNMIGLSFQEFEAFLYAIILIPIYYLLKRYSKDVMLSVLILYSLQFFVFVCSGLRQSVAMALCVCSLLVILRSKKMILLILSLVIVVAAFFVHKSAILFVLVIMIVYFEKKFITYVSFFAALLLFLFSKNLLINLNTEYELSHYTYDENLTLGLMFVFDLIMFIFYIISLRINKKDNKEKSLTWQFGSVICFGLILMIGTNGSVLMRSAGYEMLYLSVVMPMAFDMWENNGRQLIKVIYVSVLFYCFYFLVLKSNSLSIVPYKFFFQTGL